MPTQVFRFKFSSTRSHVFLNLFRRQFSCFDADAIAQKIRVCVIIRVNAAVSHDDAADDIIFLKAFPQMLFIIDMTGFDGNLIEMRVTGTKVQM